MKAICLNKIYIILLIGALVLSMSGCVDESSSFNQVSNKFEPLPEPEADIDSQFGVDKNINMSTIDNYLFRDDAVYRDVRMLFDPAEYGAIGGEADLTRTIEGFKIVPFPFIATLSVLPVDGAYAGDCLYTVEWNEDGTVKQATPNYEESELIVNELFPNNRPIILMCGGGGYAGMMNQLLLYLGYDSKLLYNAGANWSYSGNYIKELVIYPEEADGHKIYATWRADYAYIDFTRLHRIGE